MQNNTQLGEEVFELTGEAPQNTGELRASCRIRLHQAGAEYDVTIPVQISVFAPLSAAGAIFFPDFADRSALVGKATTLLVRSRCKTAPVLISVPEYLSCSLQELERASQRRAESETFQFLLKVQFCVAPAGSVKRDSVKLLSGDMRDACTIPIVIGEGDRAG